MKKSYFKIIVIGLIFILGCLGIYRKHIEKNEQEVIKQEVLTKQDKEIKALKKKLIGN